MMATVQGERVPGGFILITGIDGTRYAVRQQAVSRVPCPFDEVLAWFA
jgi:hypothetical protein